MLVASYWEFGDKGQCIDLTDSGRSASESERPLVTESCPCNQEILANLNGRSWWELTFA